jgi:molybdopterin-guanine dinucleotide biosynthesis protein MobB
VISFIGRSGSGKTTLLEKVIAALKRRGIRVAVIKHSPHHDLGFDVNGKDSQKFQSAGAEIVFVSGPRGIVSMKNTDHDLSPEEISQFVDSGIDLILTEGFKSLDAPKIEVHRREQGSGLLSSPSQLLAIVTDEPLGIEAPQFDFNRDNSEAIASLIEQWLIERTQGEMGLAINLAG